MPCICTPSPAARRSLSLGFLTVPTGDLDDERALLASARAGQGLRRLYVVLTRAVSGLSVLHTEPLPEELAA